jgi:very-short-patch-repair endonuclease
VLKKYFKLYQEGAKLMPYNYANQNKEIARKLRKTMTKEERHLWYDFLRSYPIKFYRQRRIDRYIVDFYCAQAQLVIELDGGQHYDEAGMKSDQERTAVLESYGLTVIRFTNLDIHKNFSGVCQTIHQYVSEHKGCSW